MGKGMCARCGRGGENGVEFTLSWHEWTQIALNTGSANGEQRSCSLCAECVALLDLFVGGTVARMYMLGALPKVSTVEGQ